MKKISCVFFSILVVLFVFVGNGFANEMSDAELYELAKSKAERGDIVSQYVLGSFYYSGQIVTQNFRDAFKWFSKAAEQGSAEAQLNLGVMYVNGEGVAQDYVQAHMLWNVAAANGSSKAKIYRDNIAQMMTSEQIAEAQRLAREWMEKYN